LAGAVNPGAMTPVSWSCNNPGIIVNVIITFNKITTIDSIAKGMHTTFSMFSGGALLISYKKFTYGQFFAKKLQLFAEIAGYFV
jgi:hypothetical protein